MAKRTEQWTRQQARKNAKRDREAFGEAIPKERGYMTIQERLRAYKMEWDTAPREAADLIDALTAENERFREALMDLTETIKHTTVFASDEDPLLIAWRKARAALTPTDTQGKRE